MKIKRILTGLLHSPLKTPFKTAVRTVDKLVDVIVAIETDSDLVGFGSAPPTAKVTGDTVGSIIGAIGEVIAPELVGMDPSDLDACLDVIDRCILHNTSPRAAMDIALHDLWGKSIGVPAWRLFGGTGKSLETDITVSVNSPDEMVSDVIKAMGEGFGIIKIKLGTDVREDLMRLDAIHEAVGERVRIRLDANQGWKPTEAVRILNDMAELGLNIEFVEQPVKSWDLEGLHFVTERSPYPIVADESCQTVNDAIEIISRRYANMVNVKLMKCGGVRGARQIIAASQAFGAEVMMGCMLEGKVSFAAAAHLASASSCVTKVDLDGPALCAKHDVIGGPEYVDGAKIVFDDSPGFGIRSIPNIDWCDKAS